MDEISARTRPPRQLESLGLNHWAFLNQQCPVSVFSHGYVGAYATSTLNGEDLRVMLDYIQGRGDTRIATYNWMLDYWLARNPSVDPPTWATGASATWDIFRGPSQ